MGAAGPIFWSDLLTDDPAAGAAFHAHVLGWSAAAIARGQLLSTENNPVAHVLAVGDGAAPHWLVHVLTDDLDAMCRRAAFLQGRVLVEPEVVEGLGAGAILADPAGCVLHLFQPAPEQTPTAPPLGAGRPAGALLLAPRVDLGARYYGTLLGWKAERAGKTAVFLRDGAPVAVAVEAVADTPAEPQWMPMTAVADLEATLLAAIEAGGQLLVPITAVARVGSVAAYLDPQGAPMALRTLA